MQTKPQIKPQSHFDSIFNAIAPAPAVKAASLSKERKTVYDIFHENRTDYVLVSLDCIDQEGEECSDEIFIMHGDLLKWLKDNDKLTITEGTNHMEGGDIVEDEKSAQIGYVEYIEEHMTPSDIKAFMQFKGLPFDFDSSIK